MCVTGQTGSGKTQFRLLRHAHQMYPEELPEHILYCYGIHQPLFDVMERVLPTFTLRQGLPTSAELEEFTKDRTHRVIVLDDLMHRVVQNADVELPFTQGCHHRRVSVVFLTQNLFPLGAKSRTIALNTYYLVLMKNARDASQVTTLGRQSTNGSLSRRYEGTLRIPSRRHVSTRRGSISVTHAYLSEGGSGGQSKLIREDIGRSRCSS